MTSLLKALDDGLKSFRMNNYNLFISALTDSNSASQQALLTGLIMAQVVSFMVGAFTIVVAGAITLNINNVVNKLKDMDCGEGDLTQRLVSQGTMKLAI